MPDIYAIQMNLFQENWIGWSCTKKSEYKNNSSDKYLITASKSKIVVFDSRLHQLYSIDIDTNKKFRMLLLQASHWLSDLSKEDVKSMICLL